MGLETGTSIGDLVPTNPLSTDAVSSGDDHIRLIKTVMQSITFLKSIQTFTTVGATTWTRPANVKKILIYCLGSGGGGNGGGTGTYSGGGGSSGATALKLLDVTAIPTATVIVGNGGAGGAFGGGLGVGGGITQFASPGPVLHCVAREGLSGTSGYYGGLPHPRNLSTGDIIFTGSPGQPGKILHVGVETQAFGGNGGGAGGMYTIAPLANSGGGGSGGEGLSSSSFAGTDGASGYCIIFEFGW